jgi:gluconolactonase
MKTAWLGLATLTFVWACGGDGGSGQPVNTAGTTSGGNGTGTAGTPSMGGTGTSGSGTAAGSGTGGSTTAGSGTGGSTTAGSGTGGSTAGTGGAGGGGGGGATSGFKCPAGSAAMAVTVPTSAGQPIANALPAGGNPDNLEGPVWINGWLYLSEIAKRENADAPQGGRIIRLQPGQAGEVYLPDVGTNGLAVSPEGDLVAASQKLGAIVSFDLKAMPPSPTPKKEYAKMYDSKRFSSPNDVAVRSDGTVYFTDPAYQAGSVKQSAERAYWATPAGVVSVIPDTGAPPNGIILSPDEKTLYVGGSKLSSYPVNADGSLGAGKTFPNDAMGLYGTDGLGMDCAGNVYVAMYSQGVVEVLKPTGEKLGTIQVGSGVTNVAFGGPDSKTIYITRMTPPSLYAVPSQIPGMPY